MSRTRFISAIVFPVHTGLRRWMLINPDQIATMYELTPKESKAIIGSDYCESETLCDLTLMDGRVVHVCHDQKNIVQAIEFLWSRDDHITMPVE